MNPIKYLLLTFTGLIILASCSTEESNGVPVVESFVRFNFLVNSNNVPLEYPSKHSGLVPKSDYNNTALRTLKIPVTLSSQALDNAVKVNYSYTTNGNDNVFNVRPTNQLTFQGVKLTDTIYVDFVNRWDNDQKIIFKLESVSDPSIRIGNINSILPNDTFTVTLGEINTTYTLAQNRIQITGMAGEEIDFRVVFPEGYFSSEIDVQSMFSFLNGFDYSLTKVAETSSSITFRVTLNEDIQNDDVFYQSIITLVDTEFYSTTGNTILQIVKPIKTNRDVNVNIASYFYNLSDPFYRTYGETWNDFNGDGICQWSSYNAFTYPIVVSADHPNAILYDDNGTADTSDDIYHDAFRIGFKTPNAVTTTTNSFNLKRWFANESVSGLNSPGFDINPALEFYPENGTSTTNGTVLIIPQFITIAGNNGNSYIFGISGEGTYQEISTGIYELKFQLNLSNDELLGGTITADYRMYNTNNYTEPADLTTTNCVTEYTL